MTDLVSKNIGGLVTFTVYANGNKIAETISISSINIRNELNKIPTATFIVFDGNVSSGNFSTSNSSDFSIGTEIKIEIGYNSSNKTVFQGIIIKIGLKLDSSGKSFLMVECKDKAAKMTITRNNANYINKSDSEIISSLIANNGLSSEVKSTKEKHREIVQYYCTDWDFVLSRAEINACIILTENGKISVAPPDVSQAPLLKVVYGDGLIEADLEIDARNQYANVESTAWSIKEQKIINAAAVKPKVNKHGDISSKELADVLGIKKFNLQSPAPLEQEQLKTWANAQMHKSLMSKIKGNIVFMGNADAKPGILIELEGLGDHYNGEAFVSGIIHSIEDGNWKTEATIGLPNNWFLEEVNVMAPEASGLLPGIQGLHIGKVIKLDKDPNGEFMVQVSNPVLNATEQGIWARLATLYTANEGGAFFIPEIGNEVVLGYVNNDPGFPIVLGSLYSSKNKPAYELTEKNNIKAIVTKEKLTIEFDDEKKTIQISTPEENKIVISDEDKSIVLSDATGNTVELNSEGVLIDSAKDISIKSKGKLALDATGEISITSKADITISGLNINSAAKAGFVAKGNATAELSASGQTTVKGAMVLIN